MILDQILDHVRRQELPRLAPIDRCALAALPPCASLAAALRRPAGQAIRVLAETKKGSPSKGLFGPDYDPVLNALRYVAGGCSAISVITEEHFFFGSLVDLVTVRSQVQVPLLRKDFILDPRQIAVSRLAGADAILLIVAALEGGHLEDLYGFACELGLEVLVEIHNADEAARALRLGAGLIGINNRDLRSFAVSLETTHALLPALVDGRRVLVSESGLENREQCRALEAAGVDAVLVGESLMRATDPSTAIQVLRGSLAHL